jgi:hypothetical protein
MNGSLGKRVPDSRIDHDDSEKSGRQRGATLSEDELTKRATQEYTTNFLGRFIHEYPPLKQAELLQGDEWLDVSAVAAMTLSNFRAKIMLSRRRREYVETNVHALIGLAFIKGRESIANDTGD